MARDATHTRNGVAQVIGDFEQFWIEEGHEADGREQAAHAQAERAHRGDPRRNADAGRGQGDPHDARGVGVEGDQPTRQEPADGKLGIGQEVHIVAVKQVETDARERLQTLELDGELHPLALAGIPGVAHHEDASDGPHHRGLVGGRVAAEVCGFDGKEVLAGFQADAGHFVPSIGELELLGRHAHAPQEYRGDFVVVGHPSGQGHHLGFRHTGRWRLPGDGRGGHILELGRNHRVFADDPVFIEVHGIPRGARQAQPFHQLPTGFDRRAGAQREAFLKILEAGFHGQGAALHRGDSHGEHTRCAEFGLDDRRGREAAVADAQADGHGAVATTHGQDGQAAGRAIAHEHQAVLRQEGRITALDRHGQRVGHIGVGHVDRDVGDTINGPEFQAARRGNGRRIVHRLHPNEVFQRFGGDAIGRIDAHRVHPGILAARPARQNAFGGGGGFPLQPFGQGDGLERDGLAHATRAHRNDRGVFLTFDDLHRRGAQEGQGLPIDIHLNLEGAGAGCLRSRGVGDLQLAFKNSGLGVGVRYGGSFGRGPVTEGPGVADAGGASVIRGGREPAGGPGDEVVGREHRGDERRGVGDHQRERIHGALQGHFGAHRTGAGREIGHWAVVTQVLQFPALAIVHPEIVVALANVGRGRVLLRVGHDEAGGLARGLRQVLPNHGPGDPVGGLHVQIGEALKEVPAVHAEGLALVQQGARDAGLQTRIGRAVVAVNTQFAGDGRALCGGHRGEIGVIIEGDFVEDLVGNAELNLVARFQGRHVEFGRINHAVEVVVKADQPKFGHLHLQVMATGRQQRQHGLAAGHGLSVGQLPGHLHSALGPGVVGHHLNLGGLALDGLDCIHAANDRRPILNRNAVVRRRCGAPLGIGDGQVEVDDAGSERLRGQIQDLIGHLQPIHGLPEVAQRLRAPGHQGFDEQRVAFQGRLMANALDQRGQGGLVHQADGREVLHPTVGLRDG